MDMWMTRKSKACGALLLYFVLMFANYWSIVEIDKDLAEIENDIYEIHEAVEDLCSSMNKMSEELRKTHEQINYIHKEVEHTHMSDVIEDSKELEEEIREEICLGEIEALAQLIEAEAGTEDFIGKCLVADVVLNRVQDNSFPNSVVPVIFEHHIRKSDGVDCYQFATVKYGTYDEAGYHISDESFKAAYQEYYSPKRMDTKILYFTAGKYNEYCKPAYKYGRHYFGY